jgi:hypothetical protein
LLHFFIEERSNARRSKAQSLGSKIHALTDCTCLEMYIAISTITVAAGGIFKIADHREYDASMAGRYDGEHIWYGELIRKRPPRRLT